MRNEKHVEEQNKKKEMLEEVGGSSPTHIAG